MESECVDPRIIRLRVIKTANHFKADIGREGIFTSEVMEPDFSNFHVEVFYYKNSGPRTDVIFRKGERGQVFTYVPEHLENSGGFIGLRGLVKGSGLLIALQTWAEDHGELLNRIDGAGEVYHGPHITRTMTGPDKSNIRLDEDLVGVYKIYPEVYL